MIYEDYDSGIKDVAYRVTNNKRIFAVDATKADGPFYCPDTYEELIVRKCIEKRDHFAYRARQSPVARRESDLHLNCKKELLEILKNQFPEGKWEMERKGFNKDKVKGYKKVRPDLSGRINGRGIIIEVQASTLSISKILERTEQYAKRGAHILWIVPLEEELGKDDFRPRLFERFLHTMYYGRIYYWYKGCGTSVTPVHFGISDRYIHENIWIDQDGIEQISGGYYKPYLRVKRPMYGFCCLSVLWQARPLLSSAYLH